MTLKLCPSCGIENLGIFRFCIDCGSSLDDAYLEDGPSLSESPRQRSADKTKRGKEQVAKSKEQDALGRAQGPSVPVPDSPLTPKAGYKRDTEPLAKGHLADFPIRVIPIDESGQDEPAMEIIKLKATLGKDPSGLFFDDQFLAPHHASLEFKAGRWWVAPFDTTNGVFVKINQATAIPHLGFFRLGQQLLQFKSMQALKNAIHKEGLVRVGSPLPKDVWGYLYQVLGPERAGAIYPLDKNHIQIGRERGDILFSSDPFVSGHHAELSFSGGHCLLKDLNSSNGSYVRITKAHPIEPSTFVIMGQQLLRFEF